MHPFTFEPGTNRRCVRINITNDQQLEESEIFVVTLESTDASVNTGPPDRAEVIIVDDDGKS